MINRLRESRWFFVLLSILLAVLVWMYIRNGENPAQNSTYYGVEIQLSGERVLEERGCDYAVRAELTETWFPTKEYEDFALPAGEYTALRVVIGSGHGQNWWCVLYPSLCFTNATCAVVDEDGKKELKEALSAEEYEMVTAASEFKIKWFFFGNSDKNTEEEHTKESD
mgnify:CR=1 FL=1